MVEIRLPGDEGEDIVSKLLGSDSAESELLETVAKEQTTIRIRLVRRRGHYVTKVEFGDASEAKKLGIKELARELKKRLAGGGTVRDSWIELQGDQRLKVKKILVEMGFREDNIIVYEEVGEE